MASWCILSNARGSVARILWIAAICHALTGCDVPAPVAAQTAAAPAAVAVAPPEKRVLPAVTDAASVPEQMLTAIYREMAANRLREALAKADALVAAYPTFHLGHLIRGDLLMMQTHPVTTFGAAPGAHADKLNDLRAEAAARLNALRDRPDPELLPRAVLQMRADQKHVLLMDASRSRLYLYENHNGQPRYVSEYYISQGKLGIHKLKEGDQKTPVGVYYITGRLPGPRLPDFYGPGALPINYPNEWDKFNGRGGSGIWLHGTPSTSYSRPPLSSDGCVVLTNPDLRALSATVEVGKTPVLLAERIEYITQNEWKAEREAAAQVLDTWRRDLESADSARLLLHYSSSFKSDQGETLEVWAARERRSGSQPMRSNGEGPAKWSVNLREISTFQYPGQDHLMVATFTQEVTTGQRRHTLRKRQYWIREDGRWKIATEKGWQNQHQTD